MITASVTFPGILSNFIRLFVFEHRWPSCLTEHSVHERFWQVFIKYYQNILFHILLTKQLFFPVAFISTLLNNNIGNLHHFIYRINFIENIEPNYGGVNQFLILNIWSKLKLFIIQRRKCSNVLTSSFCCALFYDMLPVPYLDRISVTRLYKAHTFSIFAVLPAIT